MSNVSKFETFNVSAPVLEHILMTTSKHLRALNDELIDAYDEAPDAAFVVAVASTIATTVQSFSNPEVRASVLEALNDTLYQLGSALRVVPMA